MGLMQEEMFEESMLVKTQLAWVESEPSVEGPLPLKNLSCHRLERHAAVDGVVCDSTGLDQRNYTEIWM